VVRHDELWREFNQLRARGRWPKAFKLRIIVTKNERGRSSLRFERCLLLSMFGRLPEKCLLNNESNRRGELGKEDSIV
jgi:hypothetical protein